MKHHLPELKEWIHSDFLYADHNGEVRTEKIPSDDTPVFYKNDDQEAFYLPYKIVFDMKAVSPSRFPWIPTTIFSSNDSINQVAGRLGNIDLAFIADNRDRIIGYVKTSELFSVLLQSYRYLQVYFETMVETMDASISAVDEEMKTIIWTSGAEQIFSIKRKEIIGKSMTEFFPEKMLQCMDTLENGKSVYRKQHQPREDLFVLINANPIWLDDKIVGAVVAEIDVTSQVQMNQELFNANQKIDHLRKKISTMNPSPDPFHTIKGSSEALKKTIEKMKKVGSTQARVLILGETGVGKELFAKALHDAREDKNAPFIAMNCGAIPPALFESDLFGYERGAFSGADSRGKKGKIELARGGTLFLDEIGELPFDMQVKLLRVLQEKKYYPVSGTKQLNMDCRVIAATNQNLEKLIEQGRFRDDLYYRLNIVSIKIPPLRERKEDIVELTHQFLYEFSTQYDRNIKTVPKEIMKSLLDYQWPGNIRELRNVIERLVVFAADGQLKKEDLPFIISDGEEENHADVSDPSSSLREKTEQYERKIILQTIEEENGNKLAAADRLGISRATLYNKMSKLGIEL